jgi:radical SAM superfamily enzyme YgiQ (UPF0313 family)
MHHAAQMVVLISTYDLGRQPFSLASPAAWLRRAGAEVVCCDTAITTLNRDAVRRARLLAFSLPMHTATRLAVPLIAEVRALNPQAVLCAYGLYAPMNAELLRSLGVSYIFGGEFEAALVDLYTAVSRGEAPPAQPEIALDRLAFIPPQRADLPPLDQYAMLTVGEGQLRTVGYTEASRGCKHLCRHCPVVPVYGGRFRVVARDVVLEDIRRQVAAGAEHITFGDPDFFNGPGHAIPLVEALHAEFPAISYDVTVKVEHLLKHRDLLPTLRRTGCVLITSAVEALDDGLLARFAKRHTRADVAQAVALVRDADVALNPTFVAFTPWTTHGVYQDFLHFIVEHDLIANVAPVQYAIRLLIPRGSLLLELPEVQALVGSFDEAALCYRWAHPDPQMDTLQRQIETLAQSEAAGGPREAFFAAVWELAHRGVPLPLKHRLKQPPIPYLTEPWYC